MTKAFLVYIKEKASNNAVRNNPFVWSSQGNSCSISPFSYTTIDDRPILIIAKTIDEAAKRYKNATLIEEIDVKDIIIDENIDILLDKR